MYEQSPPGLEPWTLIKACQWEKDCNYKRISAFLVDCYGKKKLKILKVQVLEFYNKLDTVLQTLPKDELRQLFRGSDDGYSDMVYHVIGLGEDFYNAALADPQIIKTIEPRESFQYSFNF